MLQKKSYIENKLLTVISASLEQSERTSEALDLCKSLRKEIKRVQEFEAAKLAQTRKELALRIRNLRSLANSRGFQQGLLKIKQQNAVHALDLAKVYPQTLLKANQDCLELAMQVAEDIIKEKVTDSASFLSQRIEEALQNAVTQNNPYVKVNPAEVARISQELPALKIVPDEKLARGCATIETTAGSISLSWENDLAQIKESLMALIYQPVIQAPLPDSIMEVLHAVS